MKRTIIFLITLYIFSSCNKLNVTPQSIVQDPDVFTNVGGVTAYMAGLYRYLPIEDFKYSISSGFSQYEQFYATNNFTGEGMNRNVGGESNESFGYWRDAYSLIRNVNYFMQTLPQYASSINDPVQMNSWLGEAHFLRAYTYFALVKRYGGVPLIKAVQNYPQQSLEEIKTQRSSEQEVYDFISDDLDSAINMMNATSEVRGRANKYIAAGFKSRAMLYAGSIAKYNKVINVDNRPTGNAKRVQGIPATEAVRYFKLSYDAAKIVETGGYSLYRQNANDKVANYYNLFFDMSAANTEVMFSKEYTGILGEVGHNYDVFAVPYQLQGPDGYSSFVCPTLDYVELFEGLPKNPDGTMKVLDANGKYIYYDDSYSLFKNAEPRFLATVIVPGSTFKNEVIDIRRGVYTGNITNGITPVMLQPTTAGYTPSADFSPATSKQGTPSVPVNPAFGHGSNMNSGGLSGVFGSHDEGTLVGFFIKKFVDEKRPRATVVQYYSNQAYVDLRYAEVLLNRAEAAYELYTAGQSDGNYLQDAFTQINDIRDRAGASLLASPAQLNNVDTIRRERRKELGFENKVFWDIRRWRTADLEINNRVWNILNPIYVSENGKYIFDRRPDERNSRFTFSPGYYYQQIPGSEIANGELYQNLP